MFVSAPTYGRQGIMWGHSPIREGWVPCSWQGDSPGRSGIMLVAAPLEGAWMEVGMRGGAASLPASCLFVQIHTPRTRNTVTFQGAIQSLSWLWHQVLLSSICLLSCLLLSFYFLPYVLLCACMAVESIQFHLVVISGKSFLTCRSSEVGDFVPCPFSEVCAFPCTLLCWLYTGLAPQETGRNIALVSRHFTVSQALCATHLKFNSEKNEDVCRMNYATQRVLVIFHIKYELHYNFIIFLFP